MTPIKFGTDGWRAIIAKDYTIDNLSRVAEATAQYILQQNPDNPSLMLGHDCRFGGEMFAQTVATIMGDHGIKVMMAKGFVSTPMVSLGTHRYKNDLGVVITASHNPPSYNGYKLKANFGGPASPKVVAEVEDLIKDTPYQPKGTLEQYENDGLIEYIDLEALYVNHLIDSFDLKAIQESNITLAYDAMYGAGQNVIGELLPHAVLVHCEYNPSFMDQAPEPIDRNLQDLSRIIAESGDIELGLATDGDADRVGMYDENGKFVDAHHLILLLIHYLHQYRGMDGKVVVAFSVSHRVKKMCEAYGLDYDVTKIGFKYIAERMVQEDVLVGGEESGGIAQKGNIPERDGIWNGLTIMEFMARTGKTMTQLIEEIYEVVGPFAYNRDDLHLNEAKKQEIIQQCADGKFTSFGPFEVQKVETIDGFKFYLPNDATLMIRPSGTEPVLRVYGEAETPEKVQELLKAAHETLLG